MAGVVEFNACWVSGRTKEALAAAKPRGVRLGGYRPGAANKALSRKENAITEAECPSEVPEPMVRAGLSYRVMADALAGVGKLSTTGRPLAPGSDWSDSQETDSS